MAARTATGSNCITGCTTPIAPLRSGPTGTRGRSRRPTRRCGGSRRARLPRSCPEEVRHGDVGHQRPWGLGREHRDRVEELLPARGRGEQGEQSGDVRGDRALVLVLGTEQIAEKGEAHLNLLVVPLGYLSIPESKDARFHTGPGKQSPYPAQAYPAHHRAPCLGVFSRRDHIQARTSTPSSRKPPPNPRAAQMEN